MPKNKKKKLKLYYVTAKVSHQGGEEVPIKEGFVVAKKKEQALTIMAQEFPGFNNATIICNATRVRLMEPGFLKAFKKEATKELA